MPTQSIASEKDTEALTSRKLQLSDLVKQLSHYNENVRKDALNGLRELVVSHPTVLHVHLGYICEHTCERILDGANVVRQALIQLFKQIFTSVNKTSVESFLPLFLVYVSAALSHPHISVCHDGIALLNLIMQHFGSSLAAQKQKEILPMYCTMLDISTKSAGAVGSSGANASSAKAKMIVISSFLQFLNLLLANNSQKFSSQTTSQDFEHSQKQFSVAGLDSDAFPIKVFGDSFERLSSVYSLEEVLEFSTGSSPKSNTVHEKVDSALKPPSSSSASSPSKIRTDLAKKIEFLDAFSGPGHKILCEKILPTLIGAWIELNVSDIHNVSFNDIKNLGIILSAIHNIIHIYTVIYDTQDKGEGDSQPSMSSHKSQSSNFTKSKNSQDVEGKPTSYMTEAFSTFLKHVFVHFPFGGNIIEDNSVLRPLNVSLCKVVTTYLQCVCYESNSHKKKAKDEEENLAQNIPEQAKAPLLKVVNYIIQHLNASNARTSKNDDISALIPLLSTVLPFLSDMEKQQSDLISSFSKYFSILPVTSPAIITSLKFIQDLLTNVNQFNNILEVHSQDFFKWMESMPMIMWKLKTNNKEATTLILLTILRKFALLKSNQELMANQTKRKIQQGLIPFFYTKAKKDVFGPFIDLDEDTQHVALRLLFYYFYSWDHQNSHSTLTDPNQSYTLITKLHVALVACTSMSHVPISVVREMNEMVSSFYQMKLSEHPTQNILNDFLSFEMSLCVAVATQPFKNNFQEINEKVNPEPEIVINQGTEQSPKNGKTATRKRKRNNSDLAFPVNPKIGEKADAAQPPPHKKTKAESKTIDHHAKPPVPSEDISSQLHRINLVSDIIAVQTHNTLKQGALSHLLSLLPNMIENSQNEEEDPFSNILVVYSYIYIVLKSFTFENKVNANQQSTRSFIDSLFKILFWASKESSANGSVLSQLIFDEISSVLQESPKPIIAQLLKLVLEHLKKSTVPKKGPLPSYLAKIISELVEGLKNQKDGKKLDSQSKSLALELVQLLQSEFTLEPTLFAKLELDVKMMQ